MLATRIAARQTHRISSVALHSDASVKKRAELRVLASRADVKQERCAKFAGSKIVASNQPKQQFAQAELRTAAGAPIAGACPSKSLARFPERYKAEMLC